MRNTYFLQKHNSQTGEWEDSTVAQLELKSELNELYKATRSDSPPDHSFMQITSMLPGLSIARQSVVIGQNAFVLADTGLSVVDISGTTPKVIGILPIAFAGGFGIGTISTSQIAFTAFRRSYGPNRELIEVGGLYIADISNPTKPTLEASWEDAQHRLLGLDVAHNLIYVAAQLNGLKVFDLKAVPIGSANIAGSANAVKVVGQNAYVAARQGGLVIFDVSNPIMPKTISTFGLPSAMGLAISGNLAYVAGGISIEVIDITNPSTPRFVNSFRTGTSVTGISIEGNRAYISAGPQGMVTMDITDPKSPTVLNILAPGFGVNPLTLSITILADKIVQSNGGVGLALTDKEGTVQTASVAEWFSGGRLTKVKPGIIALVGLKMERSGFTVKPKLLLFDIGTNPSSPTKLHETDLPQMAYGLTAAGNYLYITTGQSGIQIVNIEGSPQIVGNYDSGGFANSIAIKDNKAYLADGASGLMILSLADPIKPVPVSPTSKYDTPGNSRDLSISNSHALVADNNGLFILDVKDDNAPSKLALSSSRAVRVKSQGGFVFAASQVQGFEILDSSLNSLAKMPNSFGIYPNATSLDVNGSKLAIGLAGAGMALYDISTPSSPNILGAAITPGSINDVLIEGDYAYLADSFAGLVTVKI